MRTIYQAKKLVRDNYGKMVILKVYGLRNKNETIRGIISEIYNNVFIVKSVPFNRCFSYKDLLLGNVIFKWFVENKSNCIVFK